MNVIVQNKNRYPVRLALSAGTVLVPRKNSKKMIVEEKDYESLKVDNRVEVKEVPSTKVVVIEQDDEPDEELETLNELKDRITALEDAVNEMNSTLQSIVNSGHKLHGVSAFLNREREEGVSKDKLGMLRKIVDDNKMLRESIN